MLAVIIIPGTRQSKRPRPNSPLVEGIDFSLAQTGSQKKHKQTDTPTTCPHGVLFDYSISNAAVDLPAPRMQKVTPRGDQHTSPTNRILLCNARPLWWTLRPNGTRTWLGPCSTERPLAQSTRLLWTCVRSWCPKWLVFIWLLICFIGFKSSIPLINYLSPKKKQWRITITDFTESNLKAIYLQTPPIPEPARKVFGLGCCFFTWVELRDFL